MQDPEAHAPAHAAPYPKRGATIHAVEGAILGVAGLAWMAVRLQLSGTCLADELVLLGFSVAALANLLACTLVSDHDLSQGAYFSAAACLWGLYAYLVAESLLVTGPTALGPNLYARVFFGSMQLFQAAAGVSLGLVTLLALLAAGAIGQRLWRQTLWIDALVVVLTGVHAALARNALLAGLDLAGVALLALPLVTAWDGLFGSLWWGLLHLGLFAAIAIVGTLVAWAHQTTTVALPAALAALLTLALVRLLQPLPPLDLASVSSLDPTAPPPPPIAIPPPALPPAPAPRPPAFAPQPAALDPWAPSMFLRPVTFHGEMPRRVPVVAPDTLLFGRGSRASLPGRVSKKTL